METPNDYLSQYLFIDLIKIINDYEDIDTLEEAINSKNHRWIKELLKRKTIDPLTGKRNITLMNKNYISFLAYVKNEEEIFKIILDTIQTNDSEDLYEYLLRIAWGNVNERKLQLIVNKIKSLPERTFQWKKEDLQRVALHRACSNGTLNTINILLSGLLYENIDINREFVRACDFSNSNRRTINCFLENNCDVNYCLAFQCAIQNGYADTLKLLLKKNLPLSDFMSNNGSMQFPLTYATSRGYYEIVQLLIDYDNEILKREGKKALEHALYDDSEYEYKEKANKDIDYLRVIEILTNDGVQLDE